MKPFALLSFPLVLSLVACGSHSTSESDSSAAEAESAATKDACVAPARAAAEAEYGNDPLGTKVKALHKGVKYLVTVGLHNEEDGPIDYYVTFPAGCGSQPGVTPVPFLPHPLRDAMHASYDAVLHGADDEMPSDFLTAESTLPSAAEKQLRTWMAGGADLCSSVKSYKVDVSGEDTFAVTCDTRAIDSIHFHMVIWDKVGGEIDQVAVYGIDSGIVDQGVSWQNETFEENPH
jgi:hypothetical protein